MVAAAEARGGSRIATRPSSERRVPQLAASVGSGERGRTVGLGDRPGPGIPPRPARRRASRPRCSSRRRSSVERRPGGAAPRGALADDPDLGRRRQAGARWSSACGRCRTGPRPRAGSASRSSRSGRCPSLAAAGEQRHLGRVADGQPVRAVVVGWAQRRRRCTARRPAAASSGCGSSTSPGCRCPASTIRPSVQRAGLVGGEHRHRAQRLDRRQMAHERVARGHPARRPRPGSTSRRPPAATPAPPRPPG